MLEGCPRYSRLAVIVVVTGPGGADLLGAVVQALWERGLVNALVLVAGAGHVAAYSYEPYSRCDAPGPVLLVDEWSHGPADGVKPSGEEGSTGRGVGRGAGWRGGQTLFPRNARVRLNGCELRCGTGEVPWLVIIDGNATERAGGVVITILREIGRHLNFTLRLQGASDEHLWGWAWENGTGIGLLGDLLAGRADMAAGDFLPLGVRYSVLDMTKPLHFSCIAWVVPTRLGS